MIHVILLILAIIVLLFIPRNTKKIKIYGTMGCGWTKKQIEELGNRAEFIDCSTGCPSWVTGYPGIEMPDGKTSVGYTKM